MLKIIRELAALLFVTACFFSYAAFAAPTGEQTAQVPVTTTVTVLGPKFTAPPPLTRRDINAFSGNTKLNVIDWVSAQGTQAPLQLAIVIDNSANQLGVATQLRDLAGFISLQSKTTAVGVFYATNGTVQTASDFSTEHAAVAKSLRVPFGLRSGESPSTYVSLSDLIRNHWRASGVRREVLLISSGVDRLDRGPQSPYVAAAIEDCQKDGVVVHAIYVDGVRFGKTLPGQFAQDNLVKLTDQTGGYNFFEGVSTPVSFSPFLNQLNMVLHNQYLLTVGMPRSGKNTGQLRPLELKIEQRNIDLKYPRLVVAPAAK